MAETLERRGAGAQPTIRLPQFSGPLDLLLTLVERRRLPIVELSLAAVADQYLAQVRRQEVLDRDDLSEFLAIAARLLLMKSRAILPHLSAPASGDEDSPDDLVKRLEVYRAFKVLAGQLANRQVDGVCSFPRGLASTGGDESRGEDARSLAAIAPEQLAGLIGRIQVVTPPVAAAESVTRLSVAERLGALRARLLLAEVLDWEDVAGETLDEVIATLLAVLELVRRGEVRVDQPDLFGAIRLYALRQPPIAGCGGARVGQPELA